MPIQRRVEEGLEIFFFRQPEGLEYENASKNKSFLMETAEEYIAYMRQAAI